MSPFVSVVAVRFSALRIEVIQNSFRENQGSWNAPTVQDVTAEYVTAMLAPPYPVLRGKIPIAPAATGTPVWPPTVTVFEAASPLRKIRTAAPESQPPISWAVTWTVSPPPVAAARVP